MIYIFLFLPVRIKIGHFTLIRYLRVEHIHSLPIGNYLSSKWMTLRNTILNKLEIKLSFQNLFYASIDLSSIKSNCWQAKNGVNSG